MREFQPTKARMVGRAKPKEQGLLDFLQTKALKEIAKEEERCKKRSDG